MIFSIAQSNSSESRKQPLGSWVRRIFFIRISCSKGDDECGKTLSVSGKFMAEVMVSKTQKNTCG